MDFDKSMIYLPSTTELLEAGVRFKVNTKTTCLLDLRFSGRVLEIPQLRVEDRTVTLFGIWLLHYPHDSYIYDYISVLDYLINIGRDADILVQRGIQDNMLADSDSVANLYNGLWKNATLRRDYGSTPWQTAASIAGILLLVLSLLQSVCSILQVVQQYNVSTSSKFNHC
ncbi:hypothetical protein MtrunA17_Chr3g0138021 [Medicago truncatula]|uniref:Uncharacterized protein n=1 Tax=Medicago truncatula TaxID=3880 RepID=A0A396IY69_MEDTR|nr:hypothetical protein MtrunA17_Chr3g0138021 [Medicago truncatula]